MVGLLFRKAIDSYTTTFVKEDNQEFDCDGANWNAIVACGTEFPPVNEMVHDLTVRVAKLQNYREEMSGSDLGNSSGV